MGEHLEFEAAKVITIPLATADALMEACLNSMHGSIPTPEDWRSYSQPIPFRTSRVQRSLGSTVHIFVATPKDRRVLPGSDKPVGLVLCTVILFHLDQDNIHIQVSLPYADSKVTPTAFRDELVQKLMHAYDILKDGSVYSAFVAPQQAPSQTKLTHTFVHSEDKRAFDELRANPEKRDEIRLRWGRAIGRNKDRAITPQSLASTWRRLVARAKAPEE
jgi:hypothetical protein